ncbi:MAG: hypothetical protein P8J33_04555 [Pirellulaceae bacterium]|nr:hypothetical protein [Pirellulaceae bacterium]
MNDTEKTFDRDSMPKLRYRFLVWLFVSVFSASVFCLMLVVPEPKRLDMLGTLFLLAFSAAAVFNALCWLIIELIIGFKKKE